jgi:hypothetical protein
VGEHVKEAFHRVWPALADGAGPRFDNLLLASINVLIDNNLPLPAIHLLLTRDDFRNQMLSQTKDPFVVSFFKDQTRARFTMPSKKVGPAPVPPVFESAFAHEAGDVEED